MDADPPTVAEEPNRALRAVARLRAQPPEKRRTYAFIGAAITTALFAAAALTIEAARGDGQEGVLAAGWSQLAAAFGSLVTSATGGSEL